jgi:SAM-dependent methyltransferase
MPGDASSARRDGHLRLAELTAVPGARVLDLGCGDGATLRELSGRVGTGGWLLGIDRNPRALAVAAAAMRSGAPRWLLIRGDLAKPLPITTGSVDRVLCHNTLEALADPAGLLVEAHRVLRPGGQAVIGHSDFDTMVFAGVDLTLTRRLVHTYCDLQQPGWMDAVDGAIGRRLPALVGRSPLHVRKVHAEVLLERAFAPGTLGFTLAKGVAAMAAKSGLFTAEEPDAWLTSLQTASARDDYLFSINDYIVVATKEARNATDGPAGTRR